MSALAGCVGRESGQSTSKNGEAHGVCVRAGAAAVSSERPHAELAILVAVASGCSGAHFVSNPVPHAELSSLFAVPPSCALHCPKCQQQVHRGPGDRQTAQSG